MDIDLIKENIEYKQLLSEGSADTVIKGEYIIPDTHPDVYKILLLDSKPSITTKEVMLDKVYVEGQIEYNILYLSADEEVSGIYSVNYTSKFSNYIETSGTSAEMNCEAECYVEHMDCIISNERKLSISGIVNLKTQVFKDYNFAIVKDLTGGDDIQFLRSPASVDKIVGSASKDLIANAHFQVPMDRPEIGNVLKCSANIHKRDVKVLDGKVYVEAFTQIKVLYKAKEDRDVSYLEDDIMISDDIEIPNVNPLMDNYSDFKIDAINYVIKEDDLGENRLLDVQVKVKADTKVMYKEKTEMIEDAYSPTTNLKMSRKNYELNVMHGHNSSECVVKGDISLESGMPKPVEIVMCDGDICITDKKLVEDKVILEGLLTVSIMYKSSDEFNYIYTITDEISFNSAIDMPGCKIDMKCMCNYSLENMEADIEGNSIAIKAIVNLYSRVNYTINKDFLVNIEVEEGEVPKKKSSIIIYVVQPGDTLWKIAKKYYTTIDELTRINEIENPEAIRIGDKLIVPGRAII